MSTQEITEQERFKRHEACLIIDNLTGSFQFVIQHFEVGGAIVQPQLVYGGKSQAGGLRGGGFYAERNGLNQECNHLPELAKWGFTDQWISRLKENSHKYGISLSFKIKWFMRLFFPWKFKALTFWYILEKDNFFQTLSEQSHGHHAHSSSKIIALSNATAHGKIRVSLHFGYCCDLTEVLGSFSGSCYDCLKMNLDLNIAASQVSHIIYWTCTLLTLNALHKYMYMFKGVS